MSTQYIVLQLIWVLLLSDNDLERFRDGFEMEKVLKVAESRLFNLGG